MKRLLEERDASLGALTELVASAERYQPSPFAKRAVLSRLSRALENGGSRRGAWARPALLGAGALLVAATAAAAGYSLIGSEKAPAVVAPPASIVVAPRLSPPASFASPGSSPSAVTELGGPADAPPSAPPSAKRSERPLAGEDPTQVAEAVRALRKQGDAARAQLLLDRYLRANPRGALAEDALALSIEAAAARKDPRASDYARRYLARYPNGRFRAVAERALSR
jgi:hypothetical protein